MSACIAQGQLENDLAGLSAAELAFLLNDWASWARPDQLPPTSTSDGAAWRTWLVLGGRGAGKTRSGAEWVRAQALGIAPAGSAPVGRIALVGETYNDCRRVMIEGVSGLLAVHADDERPKFEPSKRALVWPSGARAQMFSAEDPDALRGPQFEVAWVDELAKWREPERAWDMLQFALRLGANPRAVVTTTPRPIALLQRLLDDPTTVVTRAATALNAPNLAPGFLAEIERRYAGTALLRQELHGEMISDAAGSLWRRDWIEDARVSRVPELRSVVVAVDPPVTATAASDACGIVVAALGEDGRGYVLDDRSLQGRAPEVWAEAVIAAWRDHRADRVVAEVNQGGDLVTTLLAQFDAGCPVRKVRATRGKWLRAEPIAALYAQGRVAHVGVHTTLEAQMCALTADGLSAGRSPDRVDALVWALTDLMLDRPARPSIREL